MANRASKRLSNAHKIDCHPLYSKPCRIGVPVMQGLVTANNLAFTILGCLMMVFDDLAYQGGLGVVAFLIWVLIPLLLLVMSMIDVVKRRRRTLRPRYIVASATFGTILWTGYALECLIDPRQSWHASEYMYIYLLFFAIPGIVLYVVYLIFALFTWRREKSWTPPLTRSDNFELERSVPRDSEASDIAKYGKV